MISIVTAYYNRKNLFIKTLESIASTKTKENFEVIAVDDGSDENERLEELISRYPFLKIIRLEPQKKWYNNSCIPYNEGFKAAKGDKIIIQNPECYHLGDILNYVSENGVDKEYLSFACFSLDKNSTDSVTLKYNQETIEKYIQDEANHSRKDGCFGWYNHSVKRPEAYHFCTAISTENLKKLGGFDEMYALGIGFDDNEWIRRIRQLLPIKFVDEVLVLHQNHYNPESKSYQNRKFAKTLYEINYLIYKYDSSTNYSRNQNTLSKNIHQKKYSLYPKIIFKLFTTKEFYQLLYKKILKN